MANRDLNAAVRALELLSKDLGMFVDRKIVVKDPMAVDAEDEEAEDDGDEEEA